MKVFLSILFFLVFVCQGNATGNFSNNDERNSVWISGVGINAINFESGICDAQDFNDFGGPDLFFENIEPDIQLSVYMAKSVVVILPVTFTISLQYSLIDLPPPTFS